jgi:hypothetical protein
MSDCIDTVTSLMPLSSGFDGSDVQRILDETIGPYFDELEERIEELLDAPFLTEATGDYLDLLHGKLYGLERLPDESDDEYRARLIFQTKDGVRVPDLLDLDCGVYADPDVVSFDEDTVLTSRNTAMSDKYIVACPSDAVEALVKDNLIWEKVVTFI